MTNGDSKNEEEEQSDFITALLDLNEEFTKLYDTKDSQENRNFRRDAMNALVDVTSGKVKKTDALVDLCDAFNLKKPKKKLKKWKAEEKKGFFPFFGKIGEKIGDAWEKFVKKPFKWVSDHRKEVAIGAIVVIVLVVGVYLVLL